MKLTIKPTPQIVQIEVQGKDGGRHTVPARLWEGETPNGIKVQAFITRIAVDKNETPADIAVFERELQECVDTKLERRLVSFDMRMVL